MTFADDAAALAPVAWYRLGESSGSTMVDAVGGHNGSYVQGVTLGAPGLVGDTSTAATFDATGLASIPYASWMDLASFSVVVVFTPAALGGGHVVMRGGVWDVQLGSSSGGTVFVVVQNDEFAQFIGGSPVVGEPMLLGITWNGSTLSAYQGGTNIGSVTTTPLYTSTDGIYLASYPGQAEGVQPGTYDELLIFDKPLTAADFATLAAWVSSSPPDPGPTPVPTSFMYDNDGYDYDGGAEVDFDPPVDLPPIHAREDIDRVHLSLPAPTLVDGRPV